MFMAEPMRASNSFVGTEEYIAPVCISWHIRSNAWIYIHLIWCIFLYYQTLHILLTKLFHYVFNDKLILLLTWICLFNLKYNCIFIKRQKSYSYGMFNESKHEPIDMWTNIALFFHSLLMAAYASRRESYCELVLFELLRKCIHFSEFVVTDNSTCAGNYNWFRSY